MRSDRLAVGMLRVTQQKDKNRRLIEVHETSSTPRARNELARSSRTLPFRYFNFNFVQRHSPLEMEKRIIFSIEISLANGSSDCPFCFVFYTGKPHSYFSRSSISCSCFSVFLSNVTLLLDNVHQHASLLSPYSSPVARQRPTRISTELKIEVDASPSDSWSRAIRRSPRSLPSRPSYFSLRSAFCRGVFKQGPEVPRGRC